ncbi:DinB family protein [Marinirhabdus gelatinilytica]|uniref:DinB family protein n=1 Tax=Marinirhabdus gelatinilytica TaxID=1703343 RepID=A0A370Q544_9FLAO|nr:DinB family protein [Marinirhabdus gelatinilytica]RDK83483.1 DinB family protein [Marinirhabdus gelatinilytica]
MKDQISETEYNSYYKRYVDRALHKPLLKGLAEGMLETHDFFEAIPDEKHEFRYAAEKWTPKEILLHLIDTERVFAYRALHFARASQVEIKGFDQDEFAQNSNANQHSMEKLLEEYIAVRTSTVLLFNSFSETTMLRMGVASDSPLSVRAAGFIINGHEKHHIAVIKERYL